MLMRATEAARGFLESLDAMEKELDELKQWKATVNMYPDLPPIMTAQDVSRVFQCSVSSAYEILKKGNLPTIKAGGMIRCTKEAFLQWAARGGEKNDKDNCGNVPRSGA